jgi:hypothetical protein
VPVHAPAAFIIRARKRRAEPMPARRRALQPNVCVEADVLDYDGNATATVCRRFLWAWHIRGTTT